MAAHSASPAGSAPSALPEDARSLLRRVRAGSATLLVLTGADRWGREAALQALAAEAERRGWSVLSVGGFPSEREVPFGALQELLTRLRPIVPPSRVPAPLASLFSAPVPEGRGRRGHRRSEAPEEGYEVAAGAPLPLGLRPGEVVYPAEEVQAELTGLVTPAAGSPPRLLTVSDGEYLDPSSRAFFASLVSAARGSPLGVAISLPDSGPAREVWQLALTSSPAVWSHVGMSAPAARRATEEILRGLSRLPPSTLRAAAAVVLAGPDATLAFLGVALGSGSSGLEKELFVAIEAQVLWREGARYHVRDPAVGKAVLDRLGKDEVVRLHAELARGLRKVTPVPYGNVLFRIADHWANAGRASEAVPALLASAGEARRRGAAATAVGELQRAILLAQHEASPEMRVWEERAHAALGGVRAAAGEISLALDEYGRAEKLARARSPSVSAWGPHRERILWLRESSASEFGGGLEGELKALATEAERARLSALHAEVLATLSHLHGTRGETDEALSTVSRARTQAEASGSAPTLVRVLRMEALAELGRSPPDPAACRAPLERALLLARSARDGAQEATALDNLALTEWTLGSRSRAVALEEEALAAARRSGSAFAVLTVLSNLTEFCVEEERTERAEEALKEALAEIARLRLDPRHAISTQTKLGEARLRALRGDLRASRVSLTELLGLLEGTEDRELMAQVLLHLSHIQLRMGDRADARRTLRRLEREGLVRWVPAHGRALLASVQAELGPG